MISNSKAQFFKIPNFRNVDATGDPAAYIEFLDRFATERRDMIDMGVDLLPCACSRSYRAPLRLMYRIISPHQVPFVVEGEAIRLRRQVGAPLRST